MTEQRINGKALRGHVEYEGDLIIDGDIPPHTHLTVINGSLTLHGNVGTNCHLIQKTRPPGPSDSALRIIGVVGLGVHLETAGQVEAKHLDRHVTLRGGSLKAETVADSADVRVQGDITVSTIHGGGIFEAQGAITVTEGAYPPKHPEGSHSRLRLSAKGDIHVTGGLRPVLTYPPCLESGGAIHLERVEGPAELKATRNITVTDGGVPEGAITGWNPPPHWLSPTATCTLAARPQPRLRVVTLAQTPSAAGLA